MFSILNVIIIKHIKPGEADEAKIHIKLNSLKRYEYMFQPNTL